MRVSTLAALMILTTVVLSACAQKNVAALDDRSSQFFGRDASATAFSANTVSSYPPLYPETSGKAYAVVSESNIAPAAGNAVRYESTHDVVTSHDLAAPVANNFPVKSGVWEWPVEGRVLEDFATQGEGIVIAAKKGVPIHAAAAGEVAYVGTQLKDYGNLVILRHPRGEMSAYAHAAEIIVKKGAQVAQGDVLGYVGQTGRAPQPQLHFAIRSGTRTVDPLTRLPQRLAHG